MRADEWSGPWPSYPCGSSRTTEERWAHFCSAEEMNSSMIVWAPLTKSPNCASHSDEGVGPLDRVAVLEAQRGELGQQASRRRRTGAWPSPRYSSGVHSCGVLLVDEHRVTLHERAAPGVLPGEADRGALHEQRAEGEELAHAPVDAALAHASSARAHRASGAAWGGR